MAGLEAIIKSEVGVMADMKDAVSKQSGSIIAINTTLNKIYSLQVKEAREQARARQDAKRKAADKSPAAALRGKGKDKTKGDKEGGGWLDKVLGFFAAGGILSTILGNALKSLFSPAGLVGRLMGNLFGKKGFVGTKLGELFGKKGFLRTKFGDLFGEKGFLRTKFDELFGPKGKLSKMFTNLKTKFPKLGSFLDDAGKNLGKIGKFAKSAKGGGVLAGLFSGGLKFAETGDTGQAVTQGAGAGAGALAGGAIGSLIAPGIGTAIGATIGGIAGDFLTEELRKMGWLQPIEDTINGVVNFIKPVFDGFITEIVDTFNKTKETFGIILDIGKIFIGDIKDTFGKITETLSGWWEGFNTNIIVPLTDGFQKVVDFLNPVLKPLKELAEKIISPLAGAMGMLFEKLKTLPFIKDLFGGGDGGTRRGIGGGLAKLATMPFQILNAGQDGLREYRDRRLEEAQQKQTGGPITIPGSSFGDSYPMALPAGSFVLNRMASQQYQEGGMVDTILEPGEKVFMPGTYGPEVPLLNSMVPRFQTGGLVGGNGKPPEDTTEEPTVKKGETKKSGEGGSSAVVSAGKMLLKEGFTVAEHPNFKKHEGYRPKGDARVGGHSAGSLHYKNLALDVTDWRDGDWQGRTKNLAEKMYQQKDKLKLTQIIHDPWGSWFGGSKGGAIGGHPEHLHLGFAEGPAGDTGKIDTGSGEGGGSSSMEGNNQSGGGGGGIFGSIADSVIGDTAIGGFLTKLGGALGSLGGEASFLSKVLFGGFGGGGGNNSGGGQNNMGGGGSYGSQMGPPTTPGGEYGESSLIAAMNKAGMKNKKERAAFLAQMAHESGNFLYDEEIASGAAYEGRSDLGNTQKGDGKRFKGRGYIQLTGRANYKKFGDMIGQDLIKNPDLAKDPNVAANVALAYWKDRGLGAKARAGDFDGVTYGINGGFNGKADRDAKYQKYLKKGLQTGGMVGAKSSSVKKLPDLSVDNLNVKKVSDVKSTKMKGNNDAKAQELRQNNAKMMSQSAKSSTPIVQLVNNNSGGGTMPAQSGGPPSKLPQLPDKPGNNVWMSYYNFANRISIG